MPKQNNKVRVAIVDSGINVNHPAFINANINGYSLSYDKAKMNREECFDDHSGHGTSIAYLIHKSAPQSDITGIRIIGNNTISGEDYCVEEEELIAALKYIAEYENFDIINISLGITQPQNMQRMYDVCKSIHDKGALIFSAFDNAGAISYPAAFDCVIGVDNGENCQRSGEFEYVENSEVNIRGKGERQRVAWTNQEYIWVSGSSFTCAYASAKAATFLMEKHLDFNSILGKFKKIAKTVHKSSKLSATPISLKLPEMKKAALFPFNKEMHSIARFSSLLNFTVCTIYDTKYSGLVGSPIELVMKGSADSENIKEQKIQNIAEIGDEIWNEIDTLVLGHCDRLVNRIGNVDIKSALVEKAICDNKNIYSFDPLTRFLDFAHSKQYHGSMYWPEITTGMVPENRFGKLHRITKPVLGVFGTSSQQGKFTLQLLLRRTFMNKGYVVGQIGTEPNALLFGFDDVYHCGYNSRNPLGRFDNITYINEMMHKVDRKEVDLILLGGQAAVIPPALYNLYYAAPLHMEFLFASQPDIAILCVNYIDPVFHIANTIKVVEGMSDCKIMGLVMLPIRPKDGWAGKAREKCEVTADEFKLKTLEIYNEIGLPLYDMTSSKDMEVLVEGCISYLSN